MEENFKRGQQRDAINNQNFYFRKSVVPEDDEDEEETDHTHQPKSHDHEYTLMNIDTIINGKVSEVLLTCYTNDHYFLMISIRMGFPGCFHS